MSLFCWPPSVDIFNILPGFLWQPLLKENKPATRDKSDRIPFTVTYNPAPPNIHDILRKKKPILQSKAWETSLKKYLLSPSAFHQTFVTYFFVGNSQTTTTHPGLLPVHSAATQDMAASLALTLIKEK